MELIIFLCTFLILCTMAIKILMKYMTNNNTRLKLPPGPKQLPIIGNMHQLYGGLIHHILRDLGNQYGPLMHLRIGEVPTIVVSSPEVAKQVFKTHDLHFAQRPTNILALKIVSYNFTDIICSPLGNYWRQLRKICVTELLSPKRVQTFRLVREEEVFNLIRSISLDEGSIVNLTRRIFALTSSITARAAFGKKNRHQEKYIELLKAVNKLTAGFSIADFYPSIKLFQVLSGLRRKLETTHKQIDAILEEILNEHRENLIKKDNETGGSKEDLVDVLLNIQKAGDFEPALTDNNIKAVIFDIFSAGSDTSSAVVEWAMSEMIKNPGAMHRAQDEVRNMFDKKGNVGESSCGELKYLQAAIEETLRLHPSLPLLVPRECSEKCEINGFEIPAKARVIINAWAIGRDPLYWAEAERFIPERFLNAQIDYKGNDFEYIPFGAGRRICPGISFGLPNIMLSLAQLLFHFDWRVPRELKNEQLDMTEGTGVTVKRQNHLKLIPMLYSRSSLK